MAKFVILSHNQNKLSFLITEATLGFLGILFLVPINLLLGQKWFSTQNQFYGFITVWTRSLKHLSALLKSMTPI